MEKLLDKLSAIPVLGILDLLELQLVAPMLLLIRLTTAILLEPQ